MTRAMTLVAIPDVSGPILQAKRSRRLFRLFASPAGRSASSPSCLHLSKNGKWSSRSWMCTAASRSSDSDLIPACDDGFRDRHTFSSYANWLVPGKLLLGRYPFIEPSRCKTRIQGEDRLRTILESGITVFCSLQEELPEQHEIPIGGLHGFLPYKATADLLASAMSGPVPQEQQIGLRNPWLDNYLPARKRPAPVQERKVEPVYRRFPIPDMDVPSQEVIDEVVQYLVDTISAGKNVYLHCWGGRGRAGVVGACYLIKQYGLSADEALKRVQLAYDTRRDNERSSPETEMQREFVFNFAKRNID